MVPNTRRLTRATVCNSRKGCKRMYVYASAERKRPAIQRAPEGNLLPGEPDGIANGEATAGARFSSPGPRGSLSQVCMFINVGPMKKLRDSSSLMPLEVSQWTPL